MLENINKMADMDTRT